MATTKTKSKGVEAPAAAARSGLTVAQARQLAAAEDAVAAGRAHLAAAEKDREKVRARLRDRIVEGEVLVLGGVRVKVTPRASGPAFRLAAFLEKHKLSKSMEPFVTTGRSYDAWTVKRLPDDA